jgi:hypothetical protein
VVLGFFLDVQSGNAVVDFNGHLFGLFFRFFFRLPGSNKACRGPEVPFTPE